jgi:glycosyltransferase involved in cell wall biosynthesis
MLLSPIFRRAGAIVCTTPDLVHIVQPLRPDAIFVPAAVDTAHFAPVEIYLPRPWTILLFARLEHGKGAEISTEGIARFATRHPEARVRLLDYGALSSEYRRQYRHRFEFVPRVVPEAVPDLLAQSDVVVGQLVVGALGLSEVQAMSCARPVIASFRYPDAYPSPPPLCQAESADAVDEHLERLYSHPQEARTLGEQARQWVCAYHGSDILAVRLESLYQSLLERHPVKAPVA